MAARKTKAVKVPEPVPDMDMPEPVPVQNAGFPIVGIGASAGGLAAFEAFFPGMPADKDPGVVGTLNILKMTREGLHENPAITLHKVESIRETFCSPNLRVKTNSHYTIVNLTICPVEADPDSLEAPLYLVAMEETAFPNPGKANSDTPDLGVRTDETGLMHAIAATERARG